MPRRLVLSTVLLSFMVVGMVGGCAAPREKFIPDTEIIDGVELDLLGDVPARRLVNLADGRYRGAKLDISVKDREVRDFFALLAQRSGVTIHVGPNVKGKVTLNLRGVTVDQVVRGVARTHGYRIEERKDAYILSAVAELRNRISEKWQPATDVNREGGETAVQDPMRPAGFEAERKENSAQGEQGVLSAVISSDKGRTAIIDGVPYGKGSELALGQIVLIGPDWVVIRKNQQETLLTVVPVPAESVPAQRPSDSQESGQESGPSGPKVP